MLGRSSILGAISLLLSFISSSFALINGTCPSDVQHYNASGLIGFFDEIVANPDLADESSFRPTIDNDGYLYPADDESPSPPASFGYAMTVAFSDESEDPSSILSTLLVTAPVNGSANISTRASSFACALTILNLPIRTTRLGQDDDGTCTSTFPSGCARKIVEQIASQGSAWPEDGTFQSRLQEQCEAYAEALQAVLDPPRQPDSRLAGLPEECTSLFLQEVDDEEDNGDDDPDVVGRFVSEVQGFVLTSSNSSAPINEDLPYNCQTVSVVDDTLGQQYVSYPFWNETLVSDAEDPETSLVQNYNLAARKIYPIVTLLLREPIIADGFEEVEILGAHLGCLRLTSFSEGSRKAPELEPLDVKSGLSKGAIAGIVVGVVVGIAAIAGLAWWLWRSRRSSPGRSKSPLAPRRSLEKYEMLDR